MSHLPEGRCQVTDFVSALHGNLRRQIACGKLLTQSGEPLEPGGDGPAYGIGEECGTPNAENDQGHDGVEGGVVRLLTLGNLALDAPGVQLRVLSQRGQGRIEERFYLTIAGGARFLGLQLTR